MLKLLFLICLIPQIAFAATYISVQSGPWSDPDTWDVGSGYPDSDDLPVVKNGHAVTLDIDITTTTLWVDGKLTVNEDIDLTVTTGINVRGNYDGSGLAHLIFEPGTSLTVNSASARAISIIPEWQGSAKIEFNGTAAKPITVTGSGGGAHRFDWNTGSGYPQRFVASYTNFSGFQGSSGSNTFDFTLSGTYDDYVSLTNCTFDGVFWHQNTFMDDEATFILTDSTFTNSNAANLSFNWYNSKHASLGERTVTGNVFDEAPRFWGFQSATIEDNIFLEAFTTINEAVGAELSWARNLVVHAGTNLLMYVDIVDDVWVIDDAAKTNAHAIQSPTAAGDLTYDGIIFQQILTNTDGNGDWIQINAPSGASTITVQNCIGLKGGSDNTPTLVTMAGGANADVEIYHNTAYCNSTVAGGDNTACIVAGETYAGHANMLLSKSNIFVNDTTGVTAYTHIDQTGTTSDLAPAAAIDYNCGYGIGDTTALATNSFSLSAGSHDGNSINEDPAFAGSLDDANLEAWDTANGGAGTFANAIAEMAKLNDSDFDSNYTLASFRTYIEDELAPTNSNLENAGHDSATIGAVEYTTAGGGGGSVTLLGVG